MKLLSLCLLVLLLFSSPLSGRSQPRRETPALTAKTDSVRSDSKKGGVPDINSAQKTDDEFNLFLFAFLIAFCSAVVAAVIFGSVAVSLLLLTLFVLVSGGILSAGILVGLYKRSVAAGFKTLLLIVCSLGGTVVGAVSLWLIRRYFHIHLTVQGSFLLGAAAGLLGGLLLGVLLFGLIRAFLEYCRQKFSLRL